MQIIVSYLELDFSSFLVDFSVQWQTVVNEKSRSNFLLNRQS